MAREHGGLWAHTWWGRRTAAVNIAIVVVLVAFVVWTALFP